MNEEVKAKSARNQMGPVALTGEVQWPLQDLARKKISCVALPTGPLTETEKSPRWPLPFGNRSKLESREGEKSIENGPMSCDHGSTPRARECVGVLQIRRPVFFRTVVLRTVVVVHVRRKLNLVDEPEMRRRQQGYSGGFFVTALWAVDCCCPSVSRHLEVIGAHRGAQASFLPRE